MALTDINFLPVDIQSMILKVPADTPVPFFDISINNSVFQYNLTTTGAYFAYIS